MLLPTVNRVVGILDRWCEKDFTKEGSALRQASLTKVIFPSVLAEVVGSAPGKQGKRLVSVLAAGSLV